ncbi:MAG: RNA-binding protein [Deltaproteobacteria bacterium]|nr:RNA-binding protein [Deltaproteobacteria bacterium]
MNLYVGNLSYGTDNVTLENLFAEYGNVESCRIITDRDTGRPKGFGFVEMPERDEAMAAIDALNGTEVDGRTITVNEARPKPQGGGRGGFGGNRGGGYNNRRSY